MTFTRSTVTENVADEGGGLFNTAGTVTLTRSTVVQNRSDDGFGGGLFHTTGTMTLTRSTVADNRTDSGGGGLSSRGGTVTLLRSLVDRNHAEGGVGGLLQEAGTLHITRSRITRNTADFVGAGGLGVSGGSMTLTQSTVAENVTTGGTGDSRFPGIFGAGGMSMSFFTTGSLVNTTVVANRGVTSGGIQNGGQLSITNSTVARNNTLLAVTEDIPPPGGLLTFGDGTTTIVNTTFAENTNDDSVPTGLKVNAGTVLLQNTLLAGTIDEAGYLCTGTVVSLGNNLLEQPTACPLTLQETDRTGDPGLDAFTDDGTPGNGHFPLLAASPAINAGADAACTPTDQVGQPRVGVCDIGAIEFHPRGLVNDVVAFAPTQATFHFLPDATGCPAGFVGTFSFTARLTTTSATPLTALVVAVTTLTNGNLVHNADGGPAGVGAQVTVPPQDGFADGVLTPEDFVDVPFRLCVQEQRPFRFEVDVFGLVDVLGHEE